MLWAIRSKTSGQSPKPFWRKSRIVGYQGESSRSSSHRHSYERGSATHRCTQAAGQMANRRIDGHDQVEIADHGRRVHERAGLLVQPLGKIETGKHRRSSSAPIPVLFAS